MAEADPAGEILFLHACTLYESARMPTPRTVSGEAYDITALVSEREVPQHVQMVWHYPAMEPTGRVLGPASTNFHENQVDQLLRDMALPASVAERTYRWYLEQRLQPEAVDKGGDPEPPAAPDEPKSPPSLTGANCGAAQPSYDDGARPTQSPLHGAARRHGTMPCFKISRIGLRSSQCRRRCRRRPTRRSKGPPRGDNGSWPAGSTRSPSP
jgi:hypothetical protein